MNPTDAASRRVVDWPSGTASGSNWPLNVSDVLDVITRGDDLPAFLIGYRDVGYKAFNQRCFPNFLLGRKGIADLSVSFEQRVDGSLPHSPVAGNQRKKSAPGSIGTLGFFPRSSSNATFSRHGIFREIAPWEAFYFIGAFLLLVALIYGTLNWHYLGIKARTGSQTRSSATDTSTTKPDWRPEAGARERAVCQRRKELGPRVRSSGSRYAAILRHELAQASHKLRRTRPCCRSACSPWRTRRRFQRIPCMYAYGEAC